ncbi:MAG: YedE family putative selenium transporter [Planctomycetota bacterium]
MKSDILTSRRGPALAGLAIGVLAALLVRWGNPANMGFCVACFVRDIAGAVGLHRAAPGQYLRPEIVGFLLGSLLAALAFREFRPRTGSAPVVRFVLGMLAMIGVLVFLGCTWRVFLRLSGGDLNALLGIAGLVVGVGIGVFFVKRGFSLGRARPASPIAALVLPVLLIGLLVLLICGCRFGPVAGSERTGPLFQSVKGPGSMHAPLLVSVAAGLAIGALAQRSRFCTVGGVRGLISRQHVHLLYGIVAFVAAALATNLVLDALKGGATYFRLGFEGQPSAHTDHLWNFGGMVLAGLAFTLAGGCPGRQLVLAGEGDADSAVFVLGMLAGAAAGHNFGAASTPNGPGAFGPQAVFLGLAICLVIGFTTCEKGTEG